MPEAIKKQRLFEVIQTFNKGARERNAEEVGRQHLLLLEGTSRKSDTEWVGRTDTNKKVVIPRKQVSASPYLSSEVDLSPGDYVAVRVTEAISHNTLRAEPIARCSIAEFKRLRMAG